MSKHRQLVLGKIVVLAGALIIMASVVLDATVDRRPVIERVSTWAASRGDRLPSTLAELAAYPDWYRWAIIKELSPEVEARMWREQLAAGLLAHREWSERQRTFVTMLIDDMTPQAMMTSTGNRCETIGALFPNGKDRDLFASRNLGTFTAPTWTLTSGVVAVSERLRGLIQLEADEAFCQCRPSCVTCSQGETCETGNCTVYIECGCVGDPHAVCTGTCPNLGEG